MNDVLSDHGNSSVGLDSIDLNDPPLMNSLTIAGPWSRKLHTPTNRTRFGCLHLASNLHSCSTSLNDDDDESDLAVTCVWGVTGTSDRGMMVPLDVSRLALVTGLISYNCVLESEPNVVDPDCPLSVDVV